MGSKDTLKKQKKKKKELAKARKATLRKRYPKIVVLRNGEEAAFMDEVAKVVAGFKFAKSACCDGWERHVFHTLRQYGLDLILNCLDESKQKETQEDEQEESAESFDSKLLDTMLFHIGNWVFERLPEKYRDNPLPFFYYQALPAHDQIEITFDFLPKVPSLGGSIYSSPAAPTVKMQGSEFRVGFFRHAIERACQRIISRQKITYADFRSCYRYFQCCTYYEPIKLHDDTSAIRLYAQLAPPEDSGEHSFAYMEDVAELNAEWASNGKYHHVLGYCPVELIDGYAVAKTFLLPGYRSTPEYGLIGKARIPNHKRAKYREIATALNSENLMTPKGIELLRFFHKHGVSQVVRLPRPVLEFAAA